MKRIKMFMFISFIILTLFAFSVFAQEDTYRASVEKLLLLTEQDQLLEQSFSQVKQLLFQQFQQTELTKEQSQIIEKYYNIMFDVMKEEMSWDKMKEDFVQLYMSVYTEDEINQLIGFYESSIGQKSIQKTPLIMEKTMAISQKYTKNMIPRIQELVTEMMNEMQDDSQGK